MKKSLLGIIAALVTVSAAPANAAIIVSEVAPWASGNSAVGQDWFELTNTGSSSIDITGWSWDDDSQNPGTAILQGVSSIGAGQSVVFVDGNGTAASTVDFINTWFNGSAPANFVIGYYDGPGLSTSGDEVNIYDNTNALQAQAIFGASDSSEPYQTFDNAAGLTSGISQLSVVGVNGAFAVPSGTEIGSPGLITAAVPEPETYALLVAGLGLIGFSSRKRNV
jgi:hypothetical protein